MKDKSAEFIESSQKANEIPFGWEGLAEKADDFDEERARGLFWTKKAAEEQRYEEMKDGIERGLNEYVDVAAEIEDVKRDPDVLKQMYDGREHWVLDESGRSIPENPVYILTANWSM